LPAPALSARQRVEPRLATTGAAYRPAHWSDAFGELLRVAAICGKNACLGFLARATAPVRRALVQEASPGAGSTSRRRTVTEDLRQPRFSERADAPRWRGQVRLLLDPGNRRSHAIERIPRGRSALWTRNSSREAPPPRLC
jgi:hypothetical protein